MNHTPDRVTAAIRKGIRYLYEHQLPNGEFCAYAANDDEMQKGLWPDSNNFITCLIAAPLLELQPDQEVDTMLRKTTDFLQYQIMRGGVWNYYTKWNYLFKNAPPDTDDTVCASYILRARKVQHTDPIAMLRLNRNTNGLFYTWFIFRIRKTWNRSYWHTSLREWRFPMANILFWSKNQCERNDVDAVVNANVLFYIGLTELTAPIVPFLMNVVYENREHDCDKWYRNPLSFYYFLSRNYYKGITELEPVREIVIKRVLKQQTVADGRIGSSVMDTALAATSLMNFGYHGKALEKAVEHLLAMQQRAGNWERRILYYGGPTKNCGWGSEELTTALCLEAINRFRQLPSSK